MITAEQLIDRGHPQSSPSFSSLYNLSKKPKWTKPSQNKLCFIVVIF